MHVVFKVPDRNDPVRKHIIAKVTLDNGETRVFTFGRDIDLRYTRRYVIPSLLRKGGDLYATKHQARIKSCDQTVSKSRRL